MISRFLFIFGTCLLVGKLSAQTYDHIIYKKDFEKVYLIAFDSLQFKKAINEWDKLNDKYKYIHTEEYMLKAFCFFKLGKVNKAAKLVKEAWSHQLCDPEYLNQINDFKWGEMVGSFNSSQQKKVQKGYKINTSLNSKDYDSLAFLIEKLSTTDQTYRSFLTEEERIKYADSLSTLSVLRDSLDMIEFIRIYNKYGFPGEHVSVLFSKRLIVFMLHFADYEWFYRKMYPLFMEDVKAGRMPASLFCMFIDRHSTSNGLVAEYAIYQDPNKFHPTKQQLKEIKDKRFEMGISRLFQIPFVL